MRNTYATVSLSNIKNNAKIIRKTCGPNVGICAVVKANAYGHGMTEISGALSQHVDYLAVALVSEGILLRNNGITLPILVLGSIDADEIEEAIVNKLTITAASSEKLEAIALVGEKIGIIPIIHLKIDTGMGRIGVHWQRKEKFIDLAARLLSEQKIVLEGIYSHFSDSMDIDFTKKQFDRFSEVINYAAQKGIKPKYIHICSSRSIFLYPEYHLTMVRPGIAIYGIEPEPESSILPAEIKPALTLKTKVTYFKVASKGEYIGYSKTYEVKEDFERIITLPLGYADGYPRRLSNIGRAIINGKLYQVAGRICMDQLMVSIGKDGEAYVGDSVTLIGEEGKEKIDVQEIALMTGMTPHEVVSCLSIRVPRIYEN